MTIVSTNNLAMGFGHRTLFEQTNLQLAAGNRYGIVGANGSGKSTLLRVLSGQEEPTEGNIAMPKSTRLGVLRQDHFRFDEVAILDVVLMGIPDLWQAMQEKERLLAATVEGAELDLELYGALEDTIMQWDGYAMEARAAEILEGLSIPARLHREPLSILSGGFKLRALLAQTLAAEPDVLLLDEPTNHLDIVSIAWLERFLQTYRGCALIVSHDHRFLNTICSHIIDVDYERVTPYTGNYQQFEDAKKGERGRKEAEIAKREAEIEDHKDFVRRFRAKATKARQAQSRIKQIERIEIEKLPESSRRYPRIKLGARRQTGKQVVEVTGVCKAFDEKVVLNDVSFTVQRGDRLAILGPNGIGKSTLLKIMVGQLEADAGSIEWGHEAHPGHFEQDQASIRACGEQSVLEWLWSFCADQPMGFPRGKLADALFGRDDVDKKIHALSGGELTRLTFARLGVQQPTVMVLDEPTNHLDLEGVEALADSLSEYPNAILFVSHDRWFVERLATRILFIREDGVDDFRGGYEDFQRWLEAREAAAAVATSQNAAAQSKVSRADRAATSAAAAAAAVSNETRAAERPNGRGHGPAHADGEAARARQRQDDEEPGRRRRRRRGGQATGGQAGASQAHEAEAASSRRQTSSAAVDTAPEPRAGEAPEGARVRRGDGTSRSRRRRGRRHDTDSVGGGAAE